MKTIVCFYRTQQSLGSDLWVRLSLTGTPFADLTDVTLAIEDINSILIMPIGQSKAMWQFKWRHLVAKFAINASGAMLLPSLVQVSESISGSVVPLAMF